VFLKDAKTEAAARWVAQVKKWIQSYQEKGFKGYIVFANPEDRPHIEALAKKHEVAFPLTYFPKGLEDPGAKTYQINPKAESTVLLTLRDRVVANFVNLKPEQWAEVEKGIRKMLELPESQQ